MPQLAADIEALREHLGLDRVAVAGHSFGGFVAQEYAVTFPDRLTHLLPFDTSPGAFEPNRRELAARPDPSMTIPNNSPPSEQQFSNMPATNEEFASGFDRIIRGYLRSADAIQAAKTLDEGMIYRVDAMRAGFAAFAGWSVVGKLGAIGCPTLVTCGRFDLHTPPECAVRIAGEIPGAELAWFENSGALPVARGAGPVLRCRSKVRPCLKRRSTVRRSITNDAARASRASLCTVRGSTTRTSRRRSAPSKT